MSNVKCKDCKAETGSARKVRCPACAARAAAAIEAAAPARATALASERAAYQAAQTLRVAELERELATARATLRASGAQVPSNSAIDAIESALRSARRSFEIARAERAQLSRDVARLEDAEREIAREER